MSVNLLTPPIAIIPWTPAMTGPLESAMTMVWRRLHDEDLYATVFHERTDFTFAEFMQFFSRPLTLVQVCAEVDEHGAIVDLAGLCWLADYEQLPSHRRACGSFAFFRKYWSPKWTDLFAKTLLAYYFEDLQLDLLIGVTPEPNRAARVFTVRSQLRYVARLPDYTTYQGKRCAALIASLTKEEYQQRQGIAQPHEVVVEV
jgi:hypothetical protein